MIEVLRQIAQCLSWFVVVAPWEQAVRVRLGSRVAVLGAGFYIRVPFVDRVFKQSVRHRLTNTRSQTLTTKDGKVITCAGAIGYSITDLRKLYDTLECAADTIENQAASLVARYIGENVVGECTIVAIEAFVAGHINLARYGLSGAEFRLTSFAAAKTLRLITGDIPTWNHDAVIRMNPDAPAP